METGDSDHGWRTYRVTDRGSIQILDARADTPAPVIETATNYLAPDAAIFLKDQTDSAASLESASSRLGLCPKDTPLVGIAFGGDASRARLAALLSADRNFFAHRVTVCSPEAGDSAAEIICGVLPAPAKLEFARLTGAKAARAQIAGSLLKSFTAVCGVIGLQPIPLADMPGADRPANSDGRVDHSYHRQAGEPPAHRRISGRLGHQHWSRHGFSRERPGNHQGRSILGQCGFRHGGRCRHLRGRTGGYCLFRGRVPDHRNKKLFQTLLPGWDAFKRRRLPKLSPKKLPPK